jgi:hypothetical protein
LLDVHPNSIAQNAKGDIYVGMNAFVVRLIPDFKGIHRSGSRKVIDYAQRTEIWP